MAQSGFKSWNAYQESFRLANSIYRMSKQFPKEERFSLTDQIRRSSRSICANLAECYSKRRYVNHYLSTLTICIGENAETQVWCEFAYQAGYIDEAARDKYIQEYEKLGCLLSAMERNYKKFVRPHPTKLMDKL